MILWNSSSKWATFVHPSQNNAKAADNCKLSAFNTSYHSQIAAHEQSQGWHVMIQSEFSNNCEEQLNTINNIEKIGFGGGCHWCTEGVFQSLIGIENVEQGWIASDGDNATFSEAVIVHFDPTVIDLKSLIEIHLYTHASTSNHSMREKYRSAVYTFSADQQKTAGGLVQILQHDFEKELITQVLPFADFKMNREDQLNYFYSRPDNAFCTSYIHPKLELLKQKFRAKLNTAKLKTVGC
jgi:peptide-methionine (S)-S-oxide reductase